MKSIIALAFLMACLAYVSADYYGQPYPSEFERQNEYRYVNHCTRPGHWYLRGHGHGYGFGDYAHGYAHGYGYGHGHGHGYGHRSCNCGTCKTCRGVRDNFY